jgi:hypothetical protein
MRRAPLGALRRRLPAAPAEPERHRTSCTGYRAGLPDRLVIGDAGPVGVLAGIWVGDFEVQLRRLLDYCDLPWDENCLRFHETRRAVRSASSEQVRRPLYSNIRHRWLDYEKHLGPLISVLGETPRP